MRIEEEHQDVFRMSSGLLRTCTGTSRHDRLRGLRNLRGRAQGLLAEVTGRTVTPAAPQGVEAELMREWKRMCEWRPRTVVQ